ncbi:hypothetical protein PMM47T1_24194 [Pseudomonas sp. M47T1]|uniref:DUF7079 family protein n=1 Tax=Pseudomonas sp. M47T1 TaxID=1179778 RepID=UPI0002607E0E|nr:hypothetical protein PMM47T1_24194 [Pseudomonas sp. M47T1]
MGGSLIDQQRVKLWWALSDAFVDNDVDYAAMACEIQGVEPSVVKAILFSEVAPVCHTNLESVLPAIWACFNREELEDDIRNMLRAREISLFRRYRDRVTICWLQYRYRYIWVELDRALSLARP